MCCTSLRFSFHIEMECIYLALQEVSADVSYEIVGEGVAQEEGHDDDEQIEDNEHNVIVSEDLRREVSADEDNLSEEEVNKRINLICLNWPNILGSFLSERK